MRASELDARLTKYGVSQSGREWVVKALHPPTEGVCPGLPDQVESAVIRPEYRVQEVISPPNSSSASWDLYLWSPPGDTVGVFYAKVPTTSSTNFGGIAIPAGGETGYIPIQQSVAAISTIPVVGLDQGGVPIVGNVGQSSPANGAFAYRITHKSITATLVASAVSDQGTVFAAQFAPVRHTKAAMPVNAANPDVAIIDMYSPPTSESQMALMAPGYYQGQARGGVFVPTRLSGPDQPFVYRRTLDRINYPATNGTYWPASNNGDLPAAWVGKPLISAAYNSLSEVPAWCTPTMVNQAQSPIYTAGDNTNQSVIIFRGITGSGTGALAASVMVKIIVGMEIVPAPLGVDRVFTLPPAPYDPRAMEAYYALSREMADAYPASYNSLASVLGVAASVAARLWPYIKLAAPVALRYIEGRVDSAMSSAGASRRTESRVDSTMARARKPAAKAVAKTARRLGGTR